MAGMIEYLSFILQCTTVIILEATANYIYSLLKMAEESTNDLLPEVSYNPPKSDVKQQRLIECFVTGNSKQYLRKAYTEEQVSKLSAEEVDKLFRNYKEKLSGQMVKSLGKSIIKIYPMRACAVLGMNNQDALRDDLESDPVLNSTLQRFKCELCYRFSSLLAPLSIGIITSKQMKKTSNKYEGLGSAMAAELLIGFWFGIEVILAVRIVDNLDHCVEALMSSK